MIYKSVIVHFIACLCCVHSVNAQLNTAGVPYLTTTAAAAYLGSPSPYSIPKKVAMLDDSLFVKNDTKNYQSVVFKDSEFAVYTNKRGKKKAYQILYSNSHFTLFCQHYVEQNCDCFEGLAMAGVGDDKPLIVRELWPFSLKVNLIDRLNEFYTDEFSPDDFDKVCDIIDFLQNQK